MSSPNPNTMVVTLYVPAGEGGIVLRRTGTGLANVLAELTPEVKAAIASKYRNADGSEVSPSQLENSNGNVYSTVLFKNDADATQFDGLRGPKLVTMEIEAGRVSPWTPKDGPYKGEVRYNVPIRAVAITKIADFNLFALKAGTLTIPTTVRPARATNLAASVAEGAADAPAPTSTQEVAAYTAEPAAVPVA